MKPTAVVVVLSLALTLAAAADEQPQPTPPETSWPEYEIDEEMAEVLRRINAVGPYEVPDLGVKKEETYAFTPGELEPYGGVRPFKQHFVEQMQYTGPGRALAEPEQVDSVKLGFIGPIMSTVSVATGGKSHEEALGIQMLRGTRLAIEEANARGGYRKSGVPFELVISNDNGLWGASGNEIVKQAYEDRVWAILGTIDGANSHIAIRVALKAEVLMVNSGDTDPTFIETNIPWVLRVIGDDRQMGYLLADYLYGKHGYRKVGIIRSSNRYGRFGVREVRDSSRRLGFPVAIEMAYEMGGDDFSLQLDRLRRAEVEAVVHWGDARESALILNQMRRTGMEQPFFANDRSVSEEFVRIAGDNAEGVTCVYPWNPLREDRKLEIFRGNFRRRFGVEPDTFAAHAYDGMNMVIWATQAAGLNRAKIRDVLAYMTRPWPGVTGDIELSPALDDVGAVYLVRFENGRWNYYSREDLGIPLGGAATGGGVSRDLTKHPAHYAGPGREDPEVVGVDEVRIGYFGPSDPADPVGGDVWLAAELAVDEANRSGGYRGIPYRLVPAWAEDPWGTGVARVARLIYDDAVWAVVGSIDGAATHLAEQVAAKARVPLVNPVSTDGSVNLANVAWVFSCLPQDGDHAALLARAIREEMDATSITLLAATDHDSHLTARRLENLLAPRHKVEFEPGREDLGELVSRVAGVSASAVAIVASPGDTARLLTALRNGGVDAPIYGGAAMGRREFLEQAGTSAEGVVFPLLCDSETTSYARFAARFESRYGRAPDCAAAQTYDAVKLLVVAIETAGLNRARIQDALRELPPWSGAAGVVAWNPVGQNLRGARLATVRQGKIVALATD